MLGGGGEGKEVILPIVRYTTARLIGDNRYHLVVVTPEGTPPPSN